MNIAILGRQPELGIAELERVFGSDDVEVCSHETAKFDAEDFDIQRFGGIQKAGRIEFESKTNSWGDAQKEIEKYYEKKLSSHEGKTTLGISLYDFSVKPHEIQKIGLNIKQRLKQKSTSIRLIPNTGPYLSTATSHHNKLGLSQNKIELLIVKTRNGFVVAESTGAQNITAYANRDQARPKRDAFVGMLPPKLAQIMINLAHINTPASILDPFCGTGVVLQEALLMGYSVCGSDLSEKMVDYSRDNIEWLSKMFNRDFDFEVHQADATKAKWSCPINAVVCESYLGQPFSAPPAPDKLKEVMNNCNHIVSDFLKNISSQIKPGTPLCVAVPAWRGNGRIACLPLISKLENYGLKLCRFKNVSSDDLIYFREDQVVARQLLVIEKV